MSLENVVWSLDDDTNFSSDSAITTKTLNLNDHSLTLVSENSDLTVTDNLTINNSAEGIITGLADLKLSSEFNLEDGQLSSTGGLISFENGALQSGGSFDLTNTTLQLGDNFVKSAGTITTTSDGTVLNLTESVYLTSDTALSLKTLNLNDRTITLGSETSDLSVSDAITLNSADEKILTGSADLSVNGIISIGLIVFVIIDCVWI